MLFKILILLIFGYVNISIEGYYIDRFINICLSKGILIWSVKREKSTYMHANIGIEDFKRLKEIARKTKCKVRIEGKKGLPFLMHRYRKRKIFVILLFLAAALMYLTSKYIWNIEINGLESISQNEIIENLKEYGLSVGMIKDKINSQEIINKMRLNRDDIAWMNIDLKGTNVIVKIVEAKKKPEIIDKNEYCNIVSDKRAEIISVTANNGTIMVKPGEIVEKDTILIGGWMEGKFTGVRYVHAIRKCRCKGLV